MAVYFGEGRYRVRIESQAIAEGKKREDGTEGNPSLQIGIMPIGQYVDNEIEEVHSLYGRTVYLPLTDGTIGTLDNPGWVLMTLRFLGWQGTSFSELDPNEQPCHSFVGLECDAICQHDEYQGKQREKWSIHRPRGQGEAIGKTLDKKGLKSLDAKFGKVLKSTAKAPISTVKDQPKPEVKPARPSAKRPDPVNNQTPFEGEWQNDPDPNNDIPF